MAKDEVKLEGGEGELQATAPAPTDGGARATGEPSAAQAPKPARKRKPKPKTPAGKPIQLVVGLGNPGDEYDRTRHNSGFHTVDELARRAGVSYWKTHLGALIAEAEVGGRTVTLAKPQSFMNSSGGPVSKLARELGVSPEEILVIHDELDIPANDVRVKVGGGHGGHNGLRSIIDKLGSRDFIRVRFGIGRPPGRMDPIDFVLRQLKGDFAEDHDATVVLAADVAEAVVKDGAITARDAFNGRHRQ